MSAHIFHMKCSLYRYELQPWTHPGSVVRYAPQRCFVIFVIFTTGNVGDNSLSTTDGCMSPRAASAKQRYHSKTTTTSTIPLCTAYFLLCLKLYPLVGKGRCAIAASQRRQHMLVVAAFALLMWPTATSTWEQATLRVLSHCNLFKKPDSCDYHHYHYHLRLRHLHQVLS